MLSPDDLLIFKVRANVKKEGAAPAEQAPQVPQQQPEVAAAEAQAQPAPQPEVSAEGVGAEAPQQPAQPKQVVPPYAQPRPQQPTSRIYGVPGPTSYQAEKLRSIAEEVRAEEGLAPVAPKRGAVGIEAAKGRFCAWHAWRPAYAVCSYCHRPFCYEDVEEFDNNYYCLEDVDKVSSTHAESIYAHYSNMSLVSSAMMLLSFAIFMLYANAQLVYVFQDAQALGLPTFIASLNPSYEFLLIEALLAFISLVSALLIVVQSKRSYVIGLATGIGNVALFSYLFLGSGALYIAAIASVSFVGLISLAYSRITYVAYEEMPFSEVGPAAIPGAQKF
jgi:hypothetical protein